MHPSGKSAVQLWLSELLVLAVLVALAVVAPSSPAPINPGAQAPSAPKVRLQPGQAKLAGSLSKIVLSPSATSVAVNTAAPFVAIAEDANGNILNANVNSNTTYTISTGTCSANTCQASTPSPANQPYTVTASYSGSLGTASGTAKLTVSSFGLGGYWQPVTGSAEDLAISVGANGSMWAIGTSSTAGGYNIFKWNGAGWTIEGGGAVRIAVDQNGNPWVVNNTQQIFHWNGSGWTITSGSANDVGVGANGTVDVIGTGAGPDYGVWQWNGSGWNSLPASGVRIAVDASGYFWVVNSTHQLWHQTNSGGAAVMDSGSANDVGVGASGDVWDITDQATSGGYTVAHWHSANSSWDAINDHGGVNITVSPDGRPYITDNNHAIYQRLGTPTLPASVSVTSGGQEYSSGSTPVAISLADLNGDNHLDIATPNGGGNSVSGVLNQVSSRGTTGTFGTASVSSLSVTASEMATGDFNKNGKPDVVVVNGSSTVSVALGNGDGTFGTASSLPAVTSLIKVLNVVAVGDLNGDGNLDVIAGGHADSGACNCNPPTVLVTWLGNGDGTFQNPIAYYDQDSGLGNWPGASGIAVGDFNGDGHPDVVLSSEGNNNSGDDIGTLNFWTGSANGALGYDTSLAGAGFKSAAGQALALADLNGDGVMDVVAAQNSGYQGLDHSGGIEGVWVAFGQAGGGFTQLVSIVDPAVENVNNHGADYGAVEGVALADMNGDGLPDIVTADSNSSGGQGGISVYLNAGSGNIDAPAFIAASSFSAQGLALGDVNGDSKPDVVLENGAASPNNLDVLINGTSFPPLGSALAAGEMHGCAMCQALAGGGALRISGRYPITVNSGEMSHTFTDISIPARGYPLAVSQTYNSLNAGTDAGFGYGWSSLLLMSLASNSPAAGMVTVSQEDGGQAQFTLNGGSTYAPVSPRTQATLVHNADGTWTFTRYGRDTFTFNSSGQLTKMQDLTGDSLSFGYTSGQVTSLTHSDGRSLAIAWTSGHISSITDSNVSGTTRKAAFTYDGSSQLTDIDWTVNSAGDQNEHFEYSNNSTWNHGLTGIRDPRGNWVTQVYDLNGMTLSQTVDPTSKDPSGLNRTTSYAYTTADGAVTQALITDPMGNQEQDIFNNGELVQKTLGYGSSSAATWKYGFDPKSLGTSTVTDPNGHITTTSFDSYGNQLVVTDPLGRVTSYDYSGNSGADAKFNQPTTMTDGNGVVTSYSYNATYRTLTQSSTPLAGSSPAVNQVVQYQHSNASHPGDVTAMVDADSQTWSYGYDSYGDKASTTSPSVQEDSSGDKSASTYNADGWLLTTISPKGDSSVCQSPCSASQFTTSYSYTDGSGNINFWGQPTTVTDPLGHTTNRVYDGNLNVTQSTDGDGKVTNYTFDAANELTVTTRADANHTTVKTDYNADGTIADQVDGKGNMVQSYGYNSLAQQTSVTVDPNGVNKTTTYAYDGTGNLLSKQDPGGNCGSNTNCTKYSYDAANELLSVAYSDSATTSVTGPCNSNTNICYDADGQQTKVNDASGAWIWTYDSLHRLASVAEGSNGTVSYQYNLRNLPTQITYPGSHNLNQTYDNAGRLSTVTDWNSAASTFKYDPNSNLVESDLNSGTTLKDTASFNNADQMLGISDSPSVFSAAYTRDGNGQLSSDSSASSNQGSYAYTLLNQVCYAGSNNTSLCSSPPSGSQPFAYDAADNLTTIGSTSQTFNNADQLQTSGSNSYSYDSRGNRTTRTAGSSVTNYGYDQANGLCWTGPTSAGAACNASAQSSDTVYCYNSDGLRMSKVTAGSCASPTTSESFAWDLSGKLPQLLVDGSTDYVYGPDGLPLEQISSSGTVWYHHDQIGSTRAITDGTGAVKATYTYDPYGNVNACTGATVTVAGSNLCTGTISVSNPFDFSAQYRDNESNLYYLRARYYDSATGQFISGDPLTATTRQPYSYASNSPANLVDPAGTWAFLDDVAAIGIGAVAGAAVSIGTQELTDPGHVDWRKVGVDAIAGAVAGEVSLYGSPLAGGLVGGAVDNYLTQAWLEGRDPRNPDSFNYGEFAFDTAMGGLTGKAFDSAAWRSIGCDSIGFQSTRLLTSQGVDNVATTIPVSSMSVVWNDLTYKPHRQAFGE